MCLRCDRPLSKQEKEQAALYKALNWSLLYGAQGMGKNYAAAQKVRESVAQAIRSNPNSLDNGKLGTGVLEGKPLTKLPPKICNYRKPKLYWFGELHGSNNLVHNPSMQRSSHWAVTRGRATHLHLENYFSEVGDVIETYQPKRVMGSSTGRFGHTHPLEGRRFIGVSEPTETERMDSEFLMKFTGDDWVETRTLDVSSKAWVPQGEIFVMSGKPLKINEKSKEIIERVKGIEYPEA